jgi:hypothetical protein
MLHWKIDTDFSAIVQYLADYRGCHLRVAHMGIRGYTVFVERRGILCTAYFERRGSLRRARLAAPKLANVMIQHAARTATHHEPKGKKS